MTACIHMEGQQCRQSLPPPATSAGGVRGARARARERIVLVHGSRRKHQPSGSAAHVAKYIPVPARPHVHALARPECRPCARVWCMSPGAAKVGQARGGDCVRMGAGTGRRRQTRRQRPQPRAHLACMHAHLGAHMSSRQQKKSRSNSPYVRSLSSTPSTPPAPAPPRPWSSATCSAHGMSRRRHPLRRHACPRAGGSAPPRARALGMVRSHGAT